MKMRLLFALTLLFLTACTTWHSPVTSSTATPCTDQSVKVLYVLLAKSGKVVDVNQNMQQLYLFHPKGFYFTDRPERMAGPITLDVFLKIWKAGGKDSFYKDHPNAFIAGMIDGQERSLPVILIHPRIVGPDIVFEIKPIEEKSYVVGSIKHIALFVDDNNFWPIWMPNRDYLQHRPLRA